MQERPTILIVEDDLPSLELLREILEQVNYNVLEARDGLQAVEMVKTQRVDLAIIDVMLPGLNGFEICQRIRQIPELTTLPLMMLTVLNESYHRVRAMQAGANDFLTKPFDRLELLAKVRSLLELQHEFSQRERFSNIVHCLLDALNFRSPALVAHAKRVAGLSEQVARRCRLQLDELADLVMGALLHDVGMLAFDHPLASPGADGPGESGARFQEHTVIGDKMLSHFSRSTVRAIVRSHHEHLDGTGFPDGLAGQQIPLPVRVVALCNRFDRLTGGRWDDEQRRHAALQTLRAEAEQGLWDRTVQRELEQYVGIFQSNISPTNVKGM